MIVAVTNTGSFPAPTITSFSPSSLSGGGQLATNVTINGTNFVLGGTTVTVDGGSRTITTFVSTTQIIVSFPPLGAGTTTVVVTTAGGSASANYTYTVPAPSIDGISPESGTSGAVITLYGLNMSGASVSIGGTAVSASFGNNSLSFTCPTLGADGNRTISVTTSGGTATATFYYYMQRAPETTTYTSGSGTYSVPAWCNAIDVVCIGGGAQGDGGNFVPRYGGLSGSWGVGTLSKGAATLSYTVGAGGSGGTRLDRSIPGSASSGGSVSGPGGAGNNGTSSTGTVASSFTYNGVTYTPTSPNGNGGNASSTGTNAGFVGQPGQVWFRAYQ